MTLQSISMKTTQNVQVMLTVGQTAIVLLCAKCAFFLLHYLSINQSGFIKVGS